MQSTNLHFLKMTLILNLLQYLHGEFLVQVFHLLEYFQFKNKERTDLEIQDVMHKLNDLVRKHNIALFLVAHYKGNTSKEKEPYPDMFKDGAAIKQVANIIIQLNIKSNLQTPNKFSILLLSIFRISFIQK